MSWAGWRPGGQESRSQSRSLWRSCLAWGRGEGCWGGTRAGVRDRRQAQGCILEEIESFGHTIFVFPGMEYFFLKFQALSITRCLVFTSPSAC